MKVLGADGSGENSGVLSGLEFGRFILSLLRPLPSIGIYVYLHIFSAH